jgi:hypothetical protein
MERSADLPKILQELVFAKFKVKSHIYNLTDFSFMYEKFDEKGKPRMYEVQYIIEEKLLDIDFKHEKIVYPPSFNPPAGDAKISMDGV